MELYRLTVQEAGLLLARGEITPAELVEAVSLRIEEVEEKVKAFVTPTLDRARVTAAAAKAGGPLAGIPCGLKDNLCTRGVRTTCSSRMLENFIPPYDATVVTRLKEAGAIIAGKLNMDEFAMGSSTEQSGFFPTRNPWDPSRVPGGSSGGPAAAVAAEEVYYALGSDTGGSIRQPASFCGIVGLKPTYGRVSRFGMVAFASSLDQIGPLTRTVSDAALVMNAIAGYDRRDSTSLDTGVPDYCQSLVPDVKGMKIGFPREYMGEGVDPEVRGQVMKALAKLEEMGAVIEETSLPHSEYALPTYYIIGPAEASSNLARFDGVKYGLRVQDAVDVVDMYSQTRAFGFGPEVKRRIMLGTYTLSSGYYDAYYLKALKTRRLIKEDFDRAFEKFDLLASPTVPTVAFKVGERVEDPMAMYMTDIMTIPVNLAGIPAISVPAGFVDGLPVGLQFIGPPLSEPTLLKTAFAFEQATMYHKEKPGMEVLG